MYAQSGGDLGYREGAVLVGLYRLRVWTSGRVGTTPYRICSRSRSLNYATPSDDRRSGHVSSRPFCREAPNTRLSKEARAPVSVEDERSTAQAVECERMFLGRSFRVTRPLNSLPVPEPPRVERGEALSDARIALEALAVLESQNTEGAQRAALALRHEQTKELQEPYIRDWSLVEPLQSLMGEGPFVVWGRCAHRLGYVALNPLVTMQGALMVTADYAFPKSRRKPGAFGLKNADKTKTVYGTTIIVQDSSQGLGSQTTPPDGPWGSAFGRKRTWRCRKCDRSQNVLNVTLLRLFLEAIVDGKEEVQL